MMCFARAFSEEIAERSSFIKWKKRTTPKLPTPDAGSKKVVERVINCFGK